MIKADWLVLATVCLGFLRPIYTTEQSSQPHIIIILADDFGWNDASYHGFATVATPHIDELCAQGIALNRLYSGPGGRAALHTGRYPLRYGFQHGSLRPAEPRCLPLNETLLPQLLKQLHYATTLVGKWHLGSAADVCLPHRRGFDAFFGFLLDDADYWDRVVYDPGTNAYGFDITDNFGHPDNTFGVYGTDLWANKAADILAKVNPAQPQFLLIAHQAPHLATPWQPVAAATAPSAAGSSELLRSTYEAALVALDEAVGSAIAALKQFGLYENSVVLFMSDNGGIVDDANGLATNWPLRGGKGSLWEGGVRVRGCLHSPTRVPRSLAGTLAQQLMHMVDWMPTLITAAGGNSTIYNRLSIDGVDMWNALLTNKSSPRSSMLLNYDPISQQYGIREGDLKLIGGDFGGSGRLGADGTARRPNGETSVGAKQSFLQAQCGNATPVACDAASAPCLFDVAADPCERTNLADALPAKVLHLAALLHTYAAQAAPPGNRPSMLSADPKYRNGFWGPFLTADQLLQSMQSTDMPVNSSGTKRADASATTPKARAASGRSQAFTASRSLLLVLLSPFLAPFPA